MKWLCIAVFLIATSSLAGAQKQPYAWSIPVESLGLARFDRDPVTLRLNQQGVTFLSADCLLVYQAARTPEQTALGPRGASGGAGNFLLNIKVLSSADGRLIKALTLVTNAANSQVLATRDGQFVVRTGDVLTLYSANFEPLLSRNLRLERTTELEDWQVKVSPSGRQIVLLHEQIFSSPEILADGSVLHDGKAKVEVEILDAATLQPSHSFTLAHTMPFWSPSDGFLVSSNPAHSYSDQRVGLLDYEGKWSPVGVEFKLPKSSCGYKADALDHNRIVVNGCETFTVLSTDGQQVFSKTDGRFSFASAKANGNYLGLQCDHYRAGMTQPAATSDLATDVDRVQVFDIEKHKRVLSYRLRRPGVYYAISPRGDLAVADGDVLVLAHPEY